MLTCLLAFYFQRKNNEWDDIDIYPEDKDNSPNVTLTGNFIGSSYDTSNLSQYEKVYIKECFFSSITNTAISYESSSENAKMLIESSTFNNCTSPEDSYSGCIY